LFRHCRPRCPRCAVAVDVAVAVDLAPQGVIIAFVSAMDLVRVSVNFEASKDKTILA